MTTDPSPPRKRVLEPGERLAEILFALIMVMLMVVALCLGIIMNSACKVSLYCRFNLSAYAGNKLNSCFRQNIFGPAADTAANKQIDAVFLKEPSEGGMSAFFRIDSFLISYFAALDIKD